MPNKKEIERQQARCEFDAIARPKHLSRMTPEQVADANHDLTELKKALKREDGLRWAQGAQVKNGLREVEAIVRLAAWGDKHCEWVDNAESSARRVAVILRARGLDSRAVSTIAKDVQRIRKLRKARTG